MNPNDFVFSLFPNDLIYVSHRKGICLSLVNKESTLPASREEKCTFLYLVKGKSSTASLECRNHDNTYHIKSLGIKTLEKIEKYTVDVLGEVHKIEKEPRMPFTNMEG